MCHMAHYLLFPPKFYRWRFTKQEQRAFILLWVLVCCFTWCNKFQVNRQNDFHCHVFFRCNQVLTLTSSQESADHLSQPRVSPLKGNKKVKQPMTQFLSTGRPGTLQHIGNWRGKTAVGLIHCSVPVLGDWNNCQNRYCYSSVQTEPCQGEFPSLETKWAWIYSPSW